MTPHHRPLARALALLLPAALALGCTSTQTTEPTAPSPRNSTPGITATNAQLADRVLTVMEDDIVPITRRGVAQGDKVFGAAILRKDDLSLVLAAQRSKGESDIPLK